MTPWRTRARCRRWRCRAPGGRTRRPAQPCSSTRCWTRCTWCCARCRASGALTPARRARVARAPAAAPSTTWPSSWRTGARGRRSARGCRTRVRTCLRGRPPRRRAPWRACARCCACWPGTTRPPPRRARTGSSGRSRTRCTRRPTCRRRRTCAGCCRPPGRRCPTTAPPSLCWRCCTTCSWRWRGASRRAWWRCWPPAARCRPGSCRTSTTCSRRGRKAGSRGAAGCAVLGRCWSGRCPCRGATRPSTGGCCLPRRSCPAGAAGPAQGGAWRWHTWRGAPCTARTLRRRCSSACRWGRAAATSGCCARR
mmetsp:Transcript_31752/g.80980  ORF Transcript_31752/g.80980 Transcript_31752/m.80980 type:complete len:310 (+) Transcript_31752:776-1705(+)